MVKAGRAPHLEALKHARNKERTAAVAVEREYSVAPPSVSHRLPLQRACSHDDGHSAESKGEGEGEGEGEVRRGEARSPLLQSSLKHRCPPAGAVRERWARRYMCVCSAGAKGGAGGGRSMLLWLWCNETVERAEALRRKRERERELFIGSGGRADESRCVVARRLRIVISLKHNVLKPTKGKR